MKKTNKPIEKTIILSGARFSALSANIKYQNKKDLMLIHLESGSTIAGVFTKSLTRSPSVMWSEKIIKNVGELSKGPFAILVNSGNANAFTGEQGHDAVKQTMGSLSGALGISLRRVLMASTGVIGERLPFQKIVDAIPGLIKGLSETQIQSCARAIMTTDTYPKVSCKKVKLEDETITIVGIAKGSGMIAPNMATMLSFIVTDAKITHELLQRSTTSSCENTFNSITVDSDMSTSDMVLVAATSKATMAAIERESDPRIKKFTHALESLMKDLALEIVRDGEGATKLVEYQILGAMSDSSAKKIAFSIANSPLVKTAIAGEDPNWGRIIMALGKSGEKLEQEKIVVYIGENVVARNGKVAEGYNEENTRLYMGKSYLIIKVELGLGAGKSTVWGCDFTKEYVTINADYRS